MIGVGVIVFATPHKTHNKTIYMNARHCRDTIHYIIINVNNPGDATNDDTHDDQFSVWQTAICNEQCRAIRCS